MSLLSGASKETAKPMRVTILDDYFDTLRTLPSFALLEDHQVEVHQDNEQRTDQLVAP